MLTRKFVAGVNEFQRAWAGPVAVYMEAAEQGGGEMDEVAVSPKDLSFDIEVLDYSEAARVIAGDPSAVVLLSLDDVRQTGLWATCRQYGVACSYISEYSLATRKQGIDATTKNPLLRMRRKVWQTNQERKRRAAVAGATGLQCNGTPTYESYRELCSKIILFFDTRVTEDMLATEEAVLRRVPRAGSSRTLQLVFSGRLTPFKGVMQLLEVAKQLRQLQVDFHLSICGDGEMKDDMRRTVEAEQLTRHVSLKGILDFKSELIPFVTSQMDLFLCCHPQGDPSCTYLETMSCGVPIAGYGNEAFEGVVRSSECGWVAPMNRPADLARTILDIQRDPAGLRENSLRALNFAKRHAFNRTVSRRVEHLRMLVAGSPGALADAKVRVAAPTT